MKLNPPRWSGLKHTNTNIQKGGQGLEIEEAVSGIKQFKKRRELW